MLEDILELGGFLGKSLPDKIFSPFSDERARTCIYAPSSSYSVGINYWSLRKHKTALSNIELLLK